PAGTVHLGTMRSSYAMRIPPPAGASVGALGQGEPHAQEIPVCWSLPPGISFPQQFDLKAEIVWNQDDDTSNNEVIQSYDLATAYGRRAQIGFAIDLSGSMAGTKLLEAKDRATMFAFLIENGDQLGVWGFATDIPVAEQDSFTATYTPNGGGSATRTMSDVREIFPMQTITGTPFQDNDLAQIMGQTSYNCTPVGQGLLRARKAIQDATPPPDINGVAAAKAIVVFSDGLQNVHPYVNTDPGWNCGGSPVAPIIDADLTFNADDISIYSIYFTPSAIYGFQTMWDIQNQTGGDFFNSSVTDMELAAAYFGIRALVDDMLFFEERGTTSASSPSQFEVEFDAAADTATVAIAWPVTNDSTRLRVDCRRAGDTDWADCDPRQPGITTAAAFAAGSFRVFRFQPGPDTTWEFRVVPVGQQTRSTQYTAAVYSLVTEAALFPSLDNDDFVAGESLPIYAELLSAGAGVTGADVRATVRVPTAAVSSKLRRYAGRFTAPGGDPRGNAVMSQLQQFLRQDGDLDDIYSYRDVPVTLSDDGHGNDRVAGDGIYSGSLPGTKTRVAGDYQVTITARTTLLSGRTIQRIAKLSAICNVGPPDPNKTVVKTALLPDPVGNVQLATATIQWVDSFGNATFPGSGSQIAITASGASLQGGLVDNLDSTFTQTLAVTPGADPKVTVSVRDVPVGTFHIVPPKPGLEKRRELSLHIGSATPHGGLATTHSAGLSLGIDASYRFSENFAVRVELVRDEFDIRTSGSDTLLNFSGYLQYRTTSGHWSPYFEAGAGIYDFSNAGSAFGFAAGLGAQRWLNPAWSLDFNLQGHRVGGSIDVSYSRFRIGAIYRF
ncbi:MAG: outer membrane beta-barrel protein, partial [bacterium]|nr:outer membrane beta-barrel protein [bacterium]